MNVELRTREAYDGGRYRRNFMLNDLFDYLTEFGLDPEVYEIRNLYVAPEARHRGTGSDLVKRAIDQNPDSLIVAVVGVSKDEFPQRPSAEESAAVLDGLRRFFSKCGFTSINDRVGLYKLKESYLYIGNDIGKHFYEMLTSVPLTTIKQEDASASRVSVLQQF
jgi:GNAT superfamily N-acetyltransferase